MPEPTEGESKEKFLERCIPMVMGDGAAQDNDQAVAMCNSMFEQAKKSFNLGQRHAAIDQAFNEMFPPPQMPEPMPAMMDDRPWIIEYFDDYVVICDMTGNGDKYHKAKYTLNGEKVELAARSEWTEVGPKQEWVAASKAHKAINPDSLVYFGEAVKAMGDGKVGGYLLRFTTADDPDLTGDFFTADTDFGEYEGAPVYYEHGLDPVLGTRRIGKAIHRKDEFGIWAEAQLSTRDKYEKFVYSLAEKGKLGWSSATMPFLIEREPVGKAMWVKSWQLGLDDTLTTHPAEFRNTVVPLKSLFPQPPEGEAETVGETVQSESGGVAVEGNQPLEVDKGDTKMEITPEIQELIDAAAKKAADEAVKALPTNGDGGLPAAGEVVVVHDPADNPFVSLAEECGAVKTYRLSEGRHMDPRLKRLDNIKATGASEAQPDDGGFLLEPTLSAEMLRPLHEEGPFTRQVRKLPVGTNSNYGWINGIDETSRATGSRWGGIRGYRLAEGGTPTASRPKFRRVNWELKKYAVLCYATDELLADAAMFSAVVREGAAEELVFMANDDVLNGSGAGGPLGILQSGAYISVTAETGQVAATIVNENLLKMWARLQPRSKGKANWYINTDCNPQLHALSMAVGTAALEPRFVTYAPDGSLRIFGRPVIETEFNETLGTIGDIVLADPTEYLYWEKGGPEAASSIHVQFVTDETVFRFIYRLDGQPSIASPLTPYKGGSNTISPFVAIATRS